MDDLAHLDLDRGERASIVLRADLRGHVDGPPAIAKAVLFVLDSFPPDRCFPSIELIARSACSSVRTVQRALAGLIAAGFLETRTRYAKGTRYRSPRFYVIRYDILCPLDPRAHPAAEPEPAHAILASPTAAGSNGGTSPRQIDATAPANMAPNNKQSDNRINKASKQAGGRTAETVRQELALAEVVQELSPGLIRIGVARNRATALIVEAGSRARVLEVLDLLKNRSRRGRIRNAGGFIAQAIREGWTADPTA